MEQNDPKEKNGAGQNSDELKNEHVYHQLLEAQEQRERGEHAKPHAEALESLRKKAEEQALRMSGRKFEPWMDELGRTWVSQQHCQDHTQKVFRLGDKGPVFVQGDAPGKKYVIMTWEAYEHMYSAPAPACREAAKDKGKDAQEGGALAPDSQE